jgi:hypothetical protein
MRPFLAVTVALVFGLVVIADEPRADEVKKKQQISDVLSVHT